MDSQPENFENLRRLLALKRHEQPPPGYFDELHAGVINHLRAGDVLPERLTKRMSWELPWLRRFLTGISAQPALPGLFGAAACAMVLAGVLYAERSEIPAIVESEWVQPVATVPAVPAGLAFSGGLDRPESQFEFPPTTNGIPPGLFVAPSIQPVLSVQPFDRR